MLSTQFGLAASTGMEVAAIVSSAVGNQWSRFTPRPHFWAVSRAVRRRASFSTIRRSSSRRNSSNAVVLGDCISTVSMLVTCTVMVCYCGFFRIGGTQIVSDISGYGRTDRVHNRIGTLQFAATLSVCPIGKVFPRVPESRKTDSLARAPGRARLVLHTNAASRGVPGCSGRMDTFRAE